MADDINTVVLVGRLTKAAECKYPREGFAVVNFTIAVNQSKKVNNEWTKYPNYFDVVFTGNYAAAMSKSLSKGLEVTVSGHLHQDRWEKNDQKYSKIIIQADNVKPGKLQSNLISQILRIMVTRSLLIKHLKIVSTI